MKGQGRGGFVGRFLKDGRRLAANVTCWKGCIWPAGRNEFEHVMESDYVPWIRLGSMDVEILEYYPILDAIDPLTGELLEEYTIYRGDKLKGCCRIRMR